MVVFVYAAGGSIRKAERCNGMEPAVLTSVSEAMLSGKVRTCAQASSTGTIIRDSLSLRPSVATQSENQGTLAHARPVFLEYLRRMVTNNYSSRLWKSKSAIGESR